eukprot:370230-Alexandrium_andersonii.AAC.1
MPSTPSWGRKSLKVSAGGMHVRGEATQRMVFRDMPTCPGQFGIEFKACSRRSQATLFAGCAGSLAPGMPTSWARLAPRSHCLAVGLRAAPRAPRAESWWHRFSQECRPGGTLFRVLGVCSAGLRASASV